MAASTMTIDSITAPGRLPNGFRHMEELNELEFSRQGNVVVYAPNGSGKSTIANALCGTLGRSVYCDGEVFGRRFSSSDDGAEFYLIKDQEGRNVAELPEGRALLLGDNVAREMELDHALSNGLSTLRKAFKDELAKIGLSSKSSALATKLKEIDGELGEAIDLVFGKTATRDNFFDFMDRICAEWQYKDPFKDVGRIKGHQTRTCLANKESGAAYKTIASWKSKSPTERVKEAGNLPLFEKEAELLMQFKPEGLECPMCGAEWEGWNNVYCNLILKASSIKDSLSDKQREAVNAISQSHPGLYRACSIYLERGDLASLEKELRVMQQDLCDAAQFAKHAISEVARSSEYIEVWREYREIQGKIGFDDAMEDIELMKEVASSYLGKQLDVRIMGGNLKIELAEAELPSHPQEFPLSTGEKNFLSLLLDLVRAKRSNASCIVIDDPVSSFDSIYKNRIAYLLLDMLKDKKVMMLTHNLEFVRLLHEQHQDCFNLYMLAASDNGPNGFQRVDHNEMAILLYADKLPKLLSKGPKLGVEDSEPFLIALIPYIRSWANLTGKTEAYEQCCSLMHCRNQDDSSVELTSLYQEVFEIESTDFSEVCVSSASLAIRELGELPESFVDKERYPLLNKTLAHNFAFYLLRLKVEHALLSYAPEAEASLPRKPKLYNYVSACLCNGEDETERKWRRKILSKKTLLNSFSHFEWNVNVFQPAIDISDETLANETRDVLAMVEEISAAS
ncbi:AAA family ATPase [Gordonibacter massiliensis (ex Traore et al. 2017)]|uniref:AAA family ATPase n=1 Tax=Gordonibacter massiliensis (ex Traore et al. 2017) TaxID=1841863 RepID=UPI001C8CF2C7|nr:AAA family ATPase [Gordonibacter massiliensis (ex Traore et al. 2017)]MBX9034601.1 AAA family ATPase [Gordonibacter massiliensis (ex Traore et al. 2017)]